MTEESIYSLRPSDETIYDLLPAHKIETSKPKMYRSKYPHSTPPTASTFGAATISQSNVTNVGGSYAELPRNHLHLQMNATFGPKKLHTSNTKKFQKKHDKPELPLPMKFEYKDERKPALVKAEEAKQVVEEMKATVKQHHPERNFITENALAIIMSQAKKKSNQKIDYLHKQDYGKVPEYLQEVKMEIENEKKYIRNMISKQQQYNQDDENADKNKMKLLPEADRLKLINDLKLKWEQVNKDYQTLTHHVTLDSHGKVKRKEEYEQQLALLEKSIEKLSKKYVFVKDE